MTSVKCWSSLVELVGYILFVLYDYVHSFYRLFVPKPLKSLKSEIILITGSASGIGKEVCFHLVEAGAKCLVLWDINKTENEKLATSLRKMGAAVYAYEVDVVDKISVSTTAKKVRRDVGKNVTILYNNAGIAHISNFFESQPHQLERTIQVNLISHFWTLREFLPSMIAEGRGHVVTSCSVLGMKGVRKAVAYCGSKFAVRGYIEALESELRHLPNKPNIKFTTVYPFFVDTPMVDNLKIQYRLGFLFKHLDLSSVATKIVEGIRQEKHSVVIPWYLQVLIALQNVVTQASIDRTMDFFVRNIEYEEKKTTTIDAGSIKSSADLLHPLENNNGLISFMDN